MNISAFCCASIARSAVWLTMVASLEVGKEVEADDGNGVVTGEVDAWALSPPRTFAVVTSVFPSFLSFTTLTLPSS